jgi:AbrB family looped-hinge helix DNA binding protein
MRVTSKGQVTIPQAVRERLGIEPGSEVDFELDGHGARLVRASPGTGSELVTRMLGLSTAALSTDEIMALTRGED